MNRKQKIIISITGIFIVLLALVGLTYAYFLTRIRGNENEKSISVTTANLELVYGDGNSKLITSDTALIPSSEPIGIKDFTVTNNGDDTDYVVVIENLSISYAQDKGTQVAGEPTTLESNDFVYTLTCVKKDGTSCNGTKNKMTFPLKDGILVGNNINKGDVHTYVLTLWYLETNKNQSADMNKTLQAKINIKDKNSLFSELSEISNTVLYNRSASFEPEYIKRATTERYFSIPVKSDTSIVIDNNSKNHKIAVVSFDTPYLDPSYKADSGWIMPGNSLELKIPSNHHYITVTFATLDGESKVNVNDINLSDYSVTYLNSNNNLLNELTSTAYFFSNSSLKSYDVEHLNDFVNNSVKWIAHGGGTNDRDKQNTMVTLIDSYENKGFTEFDIDVKTSADGEFVLTHYDRIPGMETDVWDSDYETLKSAKSDLLTLEECLEYLSLINGVIWLDFKEFPDSDAQAEKLFNIIEQYNMEDKFRFLGLPENLKKRIPEKYSANKEWSCARNFLDSYIGNNEIYYAFTLRSKHFSDYDNHWGLVDQELDEIIKLLDAGHKKFGIYDESQCWINWREETYMEKLALLLYLFDSYNADVIITFDQKRIPNYTNITEEDMISFLPKDLWDASGLIQYHQK